MPDSTIPAAAPIPLAPPPNNMPSSGISEISHLFLSAVRNMHTGPGGPPRRTPPPTSAPQSAGAAPFPVPSSAKEVPAASGASVLPTTAWLLCGEGAFGWMPAAAAWLASVAAPVSSGGTERGALIVLEPTQVKVFLTAAPGEELIAPETLSMSGWTDALIELREDVRCWCIVDLRSNAAARPWTECTQWIVWAEPGDAGVVSAYRALKAAAAGREVPDILIARDSASAQSGVDRLREVTERFLSRRVDWLDIDAEEVAGADSHDSEPLPQLTPILTSGSIAPADIETIARQIAAFTVSPEAGQSAAATPAIPAACEPVKAAVAQPAAVRTPPILDHAPGKPIPFMAPPVAATSATDAATLTVIDCDSLKSARDVVVAVSEQSALGGSGPMRLLDVAVPGMIEARLAVSDTGRVAIVSLASTASNDFTATLSQAGAAMLWLSRSGNLLSRAFPAMRIDSQQPPELVLLDESGKLSSLAATGLLAAAVRIQRFSRIQWGERTGVVLLAA